MTLDLTTFILQIVNFLVLLWLLHRFVYAPLRAAIAKRQADTAASEAALKQKLAELDAQKAQLQAQQADIENAKQAAEAALAEDMAKLRGQRLAQMEKELATLREQGEARLQAQFAARQSESAQQLKRQVDELLRAHLTRLAGAGLEAVLIDQFLEDLKNLNENSKTELRNHAWLDCLDVSTVFALDPIQQSRIETSLSELRGATVQLRWRQDARLIAGIRIGLDGKELELSLAHTLELLPDAVHRLQAEPA